MKKKILEKNLPNVLVNYMKYVKSLEFNEKPNYYLIIDNFKLELKNIS